MKNIAGVLHDCAWDVAKVVASVEMLIASAEENTGDVDEIRARARKLPPLAGQAMYVLTYTQCLYPNPATKRAARGR